MRMKARRGAVIVMVGIMMVTLVSVSAVSIDFSRLWSLRNELQTTADASALAGAIQLLPPNNAGTTVAVVNSYANLNPAMQNTVTVESVELGDWDDVLRTFTPGTPVTDAVRVVVSRQSSGLIMALMGIAAPRMQARAVAWADAPVVNSAGCIKPVAIPMTQMMYRINQYRNIPNTPDDSGMYRPFDNVDDLAALNNMTDAQRTFSLKIGAGQVNDTLGRMSGSYQAVKLGKYWDVSTGQYADPAPDNRGADAYKEHLGGVTCHTLTVGDSLQTQSGNMAGPTVCGAIGAACPSGAGPGICATLPGATDNTPRNDSAYGECRKADGSQGVDVKAAFYMCSTGCQGQATVEVSLLGAFTLMKVYPQGSLPNQSQSFEMAEIVGIFKPVGDPGTVGAGATILRRPILVK
jgi:hypothetical protein